MNEIKNAVHIIAFHNGLKYWLTGVEIKHTDRGSFLNGKWSQDASQSTPWAASYAAIIRRRFLEESGQPTRIALTRGDAAELIEEGE